MFLMRGLAAMSAVAVLSMIAVGCSSGLDKTDADSRCTQEQMDLNYFFDAHVFAQCEQCYETCGDSCVRNGTSPITYSCLGVTLPGTGGSGGSSGNTKTDGGT